MIFVLKSIPAATGLIYFLACTDSRMAAVQPSVIDGDRCHRGKHSIMSHDASPVDIPNRDATPAGIRDLQVRWRMALLGSAWIQRRS